MPKPPTPRGFTISQERQVFHIGENFLFHDYGVDGEQPVIVFATLPAPDILEKVDGWFCDRTFSTTSDGLYRVYTIHPTK